jgi:hypothetical protein
VIAPSQDFRAVLFAYFIAAAAVLPRGCLQGA